MSAVTNVQLRDNPAQSNCPTKIDWDEAMTAFVTGGDSLSKLARNYGVSNLTMYKHAKRAHWPEERAAYRKRLQRHARQEAFTRGVLNEIDRLRKLRRLVDNAIEDLSTRYDADGAAHLLKLIAIEREIIDGLPKDKSAEAVLREHVERTLALVGLGTEPSNGEPKDPGPGVYVSKEPVDVSPPPVRVRHEPDSDSG